MRYACHLVIIDEWVDSQHAIYLKAFYMIGDSLTDIRRKFLRHYNLGHHGRVPSCHAIMLWVENFFETGSAKKPQQDFNKLPQPRKSWICSGVNREKPIMLCKKIRNIYLPNTTLWSEVLPIINSSCARTLNQQTKWLSSNGHHLMDIIFRKWIIFWGGDADLLVIYFLFLTIKIKKLSRFYKNCNIMKE